MAVIDVGPDCTDRSSTVGGKYVIVNLENPANDTGTIDTVCIWAVSDLAGLEYASFTKSGAVFTINGDTDGSNLSASGQTTHTAAGCDFTAFGINTGEYLGHDGIDQGTTERDESGAGGFWYLNSTIPECSGQAFTERNDDASSCYGTGVTAAGAVAPTLRRPHDNYIRNLITR